jgi:hypothetical protein
MGLGDGQNQFVPLLPVELDREISVVAYKEQEQFRRLPRVNENVDWTVLTSVHFGDLVILAVGCLNEYRKWAGDRGRRFAEPGLKPNAHGGQVPHPDPLIIPIRPINAVELQPRSELPFQFGSFVELFAVKPVRMKREACDDEPREKAHGFDLHFRPLPSWFHTSQEERRRKAAAEEDESMDDIYSIPAAVEHALQPVADECPERHGEILIGLAQLPKCPARGGRSGRHPL